MDHGLLPKILRVPGNISVTIASLEPNDGFPHSGISGKMIPYDLNTTSFFECNDKVDLSSGETYYLISQNYPLSPTSEITGCSIKFSTSGSRQGIRGFATEDEPVVYYFQSETEVTFSISHQDHSFTQKRFYILVNSYEISTSKTCDSTGKFDVAVGQTINFGTRQFGVNPYDNNLICGYDYTRTPGTNTLFALAIQYESEKCCDTMSIDGLTDDQQIYQGFQYSNLFFTDSQNISFIFNSDPIMGGTGLNGSLEHIDCTCSPGIILVKNNTLTSPGYSNSISYCPDLLCTSKIEFQNDLYDLQLDFTDISLRSYSLNNDTDSVTVFNSYDHPLVIMKPSYFGFMNFWATVSPVTVQFVSKSLTAFPLNMIGRGFSMNLNLVKKNFVTEKVAFNDGFFLKDISKLDLASGKTFEFIVTGRPGTQIHMHFFTKVSNQVFVDIFDGDSMDAPRIDNKELYSNIIENGYSIELSTTSEKAVIHIRGNPTFLEPGTDFQALVTDKSKTPECGLWVYTLKQQQKDSEKLLVKGKDCIKILHFTDSSYSQSAFMVFSYTADIPMNIYYGLNASSNNLISSQTSDLRPAYLFTSYLVLQYTASEMSEVHFFWDISGQVIPAVMNSDQTLMLMSDDYLKIDSGNTIQQFIVELKDSNTGMMCEFLADSGKGTGTLTWSSYTNEIKKESFSPATRSLKFTSCAEKLLVDYTSPGGSDNGLFVKISKADLRCSSHRSISAVVLLIFFISSLFI
ncbi:hypothetical protein GCK72_025238 [Caenorhabditis remanei]|uniref:Uncharacterized protein n=1 Tax=Caenorhabditis remanei TaxID=31234 RepID=A0A6A5G1Y0_CAERE|nr:hypothetical protein GCK72_025238 [Caenorhabditis remanei]KAF1748771.1 hypothetical protein GCK72_025238 [Caenorhabditis remanei]